MEVEKFQPSGNNSVCAEAFRLTARPRTRAAEREHLLHGVHRDNFAFTYL
jgi:hypothetical protein